MGRTPLHPWKLVLKLLNQHGISHSALARHLGVNSGNFCRMVHRLGRLRPERALQLAEFFPETNVRYWIQAQADCDSFEMEQVLASNASVTARSPIRPAPITEPPRMTADGSPSRDSRLSASRATSARRLGSGTLRRKLKI